MNTIFNCCSILNKKNIAKTTLIRLFIIMVSSSLLINCESNTTSTDTAVHFYSKNGALVKTFIFSTKDFGLNTTYTPTSQLKGNITSANVQLNYKLVSVVIKPNSENAHRFAGIGNHAIFKNPELISSFSIKVIKVIDAGPQPTNLKNPHIN